MEMGLCAIRIYTPEIYPVHIRALGSSTSMGLGRIGGAIGGYAVGTFWEPAMCTGCGRFWEPAPCLRA